MRVGKGDFDTSNGGDPADSQVLRADHQSSGGHRDVPTLEKIGFVQHEEGRDGVDGRVRY